MSSEEGFKYFLKKLIGSKEFPFAESNWKKMKAMLPDNEMSGEEQFKDSLKNLFETKEFAFEESHWKKMKAMLPEKEDKNRLVPILLSGLGFLLIGLLGFLIGISQGSEAAEHKSSQAGHQPSGASHKSQKLIQESQDVKDKVQEVKSETQDIKTEKKAESFVKEKNVAIEKTASSETSIQKNIRHTNKKTVNQISVPEIAMPVAVNTIDKKKEDTKNQKISSNEQQETTVPSEMLVTEKIAETVIANNTMTTTASEEKKMAEPEAEIKREDATKQELAIEIKEENSKTKNVIEETKSVPISDSVVAAKKDTTVISKDSAQTISKISDAELPKTKKPVMYFEAGGAYLLGWKNEGRREGNGLNPIVGFNYYNYLSEKFAISLGAQYMSVNNLNYYSNTSKKVTRYGFGEESEVTVITPQKIHYFIVPIKLNYFIDSNNTFGAGFNVGYLLTVDSKVETYTMHLNSKQNNKTYTASGYTEGFRTFDSQFSVFYRRRLYKNLGINAELFLGLSDIKNDVFFNSNVKERNRGLKLTLTYTILK